MAQPSTPVMPENVIQTLTDDEDDVYFGSYGHYSIHEEMLKVNRKIFKFYGIDYSFSC